MSVDAPLPPSPPGPSRWGARSRSTVVALLLVAVSGAALTGAVIAGHRAPIAFTASSAAAQSSPTPSPRAGHEHGLRRLGRDGLGFGSACVGALPTVGRFPGGRAFGCRLGTVTGISGSTLTVRTLTGTMTITTTSSTSFSKGDQTITLKGIHVNDVVQVRPDGPLSGQTSSITARSIAVVLPMLFGRVQSVSGKTITIVTATGQLAYVTSGGSTVYKMAGSAASNSDVKTGTYIAAQGQLIDATHLAASRVVISSANAFERPKFAPAKPSPSGSATAT